MFKTRKPLPGTPPGLAHPHEPPRPGLKSVLSVVEYTEGDLVRRTVASIADLPACDDPGRMYWIEINGIENVEQMRQLEVKYRLHPLALEDVLHTPQRPKMEPYEDHLFIIAQMLYRTPDSKLCGEQVSMFLGKNLLITIQEDPEHDVFDPVRQRLLKGRGYIRKLGPDYLAYALLDSIIDHCFPLLEALGDALEGMEDQVLENPQRKTMTEIHEYRRTLMHLRRFVWPERDVISALLHDDSGLVSPQTKVFLRDCYDHTVQIMDLVESYRDVIGGLMELYLSALSMKTNEIMRVLTVMSSIFIPLTFIAGLYGMNFAPEANGRKLPWNMPELYHPLGYLGCLFLMAATAAGLLLFFRRKKWI
ncbi:MAG TPA: magnesium/cobalt transporter CorA [Chthoniobacteraceae bacterium]|jgi:magnesium transporter